MAGQSAVQLSIIFFAPAGSDPAGIADTARALTGSPRLSHAPVSWSLPSHGALDTGEVVDVVTERMHTAGDTLASAGYTGVCHSLLLARELEPECADGRSNDEGTGLRDLFPEAPAILLAPYPDPRRAEAAAVYARHFDLFARGIIPGAGKEPARLLAATGGHTRSLPVALLRPGTVPEALAEELRRTERRSDGAAILAPAADSDAVGVIEAALQRLDGASADRHRYALVPFGAEWLGSVGEPTTATPAATETGACRLPCVRTSDNVNELRASEAETPTTVLRAIVRERSALRFEGPCDGNPPPGRTVHASMMGTASLQVDGCEVQFSRGRLSRFAAAGSGRRAQLLADPIGGALHTANGRWELTAETAFSFEDAAGGRGLMSILSLGRETFEAPGRLLVDYEAVGDFRWLIVDLCFEFPVPGEDTTVTELTPFALPIRLADEPDEQVISTVYPDGSGSRIDIRGMSGDGCAFGSLLQLGSRLTIAALAPRPQVTAAFRFSVRRGLLGPVLTVYPFGRFGPEAVRERAGSASRVRFAMAAGRHEYREIADAPAPVLEQHVRS